MYWKFLRGGAHSPFTGFSWASRGGVWVTADAAELCIQGIHACRIADLPYWLSDELWEIELADPVREGEDKVVGSRARLVGRVVDWTEQMQRDLSEGCVRRTGLHAAEELRASGLSEEAAALEAGSLAELSAVVVAIAGRLPGRASRAAVKLCGYLQDAIEMVDVYPVATIAYIAARAANQRSGPAATNYYVLEREWQSGWLAENLRLAADL